MSDIHLNVLDRISIASPCDMRWEDMEGDEKTRFCGACSLHVHNIAAMTREEAISLVERHVREKGGRLCARLYRRADGTVLTKDCPVGLAALRDRARRRVAGAVALLGFLCTGSFLWATRQREAWAQARLRHVEPFATLIAWITPAPPPAIVGKMAMGDVCVVPPPPLTPGINPPVQNPGAPGTESPTPEPKENRP